MKNNLLIISVLLLFFTSCIVQSPKYSTLEKVMTLKLGMTRPEVEKTLGLGPYSLKSTTDTSISFIYVYRVKERKTIYLNTKPLNGREVTGKYIQLEVVYSKKDERVINMESCNLCPDNLESVSKVDVEKIILFVTATLPAILIFFGLQK